MPYSPDSLKHVVDSLQSIISVSNSENDLVQKVAWFALIPFAVAFAFIIFIVYRSKREALFSQKEAELNRQISEVEMKALRSQLNPHFIFNCLNSIHQFVHSNDNKSAGNYLVKFSKLMRLVLENSTHREVPLQDDLDALTMYIEMEKLRMQNNFEFRINIAADVNPASVLVPPLIVQPFVENSIWHGLNVKKENGRLLIEISRSGASLRYVVEDNGDGTGQSAPAMHDGKKKSLGMSLTRERLEILNRTKNCDASFVIADVTDPSGKISGKRVTLNLPYEEDTL